jgi:two-component system LytT family response regulator
MPKINGFEMLELIEQPPSVIFTTAFDEYAIKAFEAHAVDYQNLLAMIVSIKHLKWVK